MVKRLIGVSLLAVFAGLLLAVPAAAVEDEDAPPPIRDYPSIEEIGTRSETALDFYPEPYEAPSLFPKIAIPLLGVGGLVTFAVLVLYLLWQPRFSDERRSQQGRR
jgi:hypothetical protein